MDAGVSHRFVPTADGLTDLFRRYEEERSLSGMSATLQRVSPRQRVDTIVTILGLNAAGGWRREDDESAEELWLRYLTPVLAETRESAAALALALEGGLPGEFVPPFEDEREKVARREPLAAASPLTSPSAARLAALARREGGKNSLRAGRLARQGACPRGSPDDCARRGLAARPR